jgi:hypothetical protein
MKDVNIDLLDLIKGEMCESIVADENQNSIVNIKSQEKWLFVVATMKKREFHVRGLRRGRGNVIKKLKQRIKRGIVKRGRFGTTCVTVCAVALMCLQQKPKY